MKKHLPSNNSSPCKGDRRGSDVDNPGGPSPSLGDHRGFYISSPLLIGSLPLGGNHPIRLQSMTNTDTLDTKASVVQCIRIIEAGADFVRLTAQGVREAENLAVIKSELRKAGFSTPLIADIHFNPAAAETAARLVEKVRINPGNYTDKRASFQSVELTEKQYNEELERIHSRLLPLINICREYGTVIRVGINHGSLSDRIMTRYGNTPGGMVQSALEFIHIFRNENFNNLVLSMKSSDTDVMIKSTRMLVSEMQKEGVAYPVHLGVTEAGEGEDGRIRSAAGIGALLQDGIGDTIRVSLSEDPEKEIPVAKKLAEFFSKDMAELMASHRPDLLSYTTPENTPAIFRGINGPIVIADFRTIKDIKPETWLMAGFRNENGKITRTDSSADLILSGYIPGDLPEAVNLAVPHAEWVRNRHLPNVFPIRPYDDTEAGNDISEKLNIIIPEPGNRISFPGKYSPGNSLVIFHYNGVQQAHEPFRFMAELQEKGMKQNIILNPQFNESSPEDLRIRAAGLLGIHLTDKRIAGIMIGNASPAGFSELTGIAFSILQCTDKRITRTIYLSCPTCGRTKFNLQETVKKIKAATGHLKGLKIAVMGCIVNGPGEMAGADYGYVGAAPGKVHIYKGTIPVLKNVPEENAIEELLKVINSNRFYD